MSKRRRSSSSETSESARSKSARSDPVSLSRQYASAEVDGKSGGRTRGISTSKCRGLCSSYSFADSRPNRATHQNEIIQEELQTISEEKEHHESDVMNKIDAASFFFRRVSYKAM